MESIRNKIREAVDDNPITAVSVVALAGAIGERVAIWLIF